MKRGNTVFIKKPVPKKQPTKIYCIASRLDCKEYLVMTMRPHDFIFITLQAAKEIFARYLKKKGPSAIEHSTAVKELEDFYPVIISLDGDSHEQIFNTWKLSDQLLEIAHPIPGIQHVSLLEMKNGFIDEFEAFDVMHHVDKNH